MTMDAARAWLAAAGIGLLCGCAPALTQPPPITALGSPAGAGAAAVASPGDVDHLLAEAGALFGRRPDMHSVATAYSTYLAAARADESRVEGLLGAARTAAWIIEHESDEQRRSRLATEAVQACQWCTVRAPADVACKYRLSCSVNGMMSWIRSTRCVPCGSNRRRYSRYPS